MHSKIEPPYSSDCPMLEFEVFGDIKNHWFSTYWLELFVINVQANYSVIRQSPCSKIRKVMFAMNAERKPCRDIQTEISPHSLSREQLQLQHQNNHFPSLMPFQCFWVSQLKSRLTRTQVGQMKSFINREKKEKERERERERQSISTQSKSDQWLGSPKKLKAIRTRPGVKIMHWHWIIYCRNRFKARKRK